MSGITIPINLELTKESRALIDAILGATPGLVPKPAPSPAPSPASAAITPPALGDYWPGQGGFYAGKLPAVGNQPEVHMIVSEAEAEELAWGPRDHDVAGAGSRHDGRANTQTLLASSKSHPAAAWAAAYTADEQTGFHLPSQMELFLASIYVPEKFNKDGWYWSSTQLSAFNAFAQDFESGGSLWDGKGSKFRVRAFRWIQL